MSNALVNLRLYGPRRGPGLAAAFSFFAVALAPTCVCAQAAAQKPGAATTAKKPVAAPPSKKSWSAPRTKWGDPDLQGVWAGFENIPLERPKALGDKKFYTDAELADRVAKAEARNKQRRALIAEGKVEHEGFRAVPNYNAIFAYSESEGPPHISNRTSAIVDPADGRIPAWTLEQVEYWEEREALDQGARRDRLHRRHQPEYALHQRGERSGADELGIGVWRRERHRARPARRAGGG